MEAKPRLFRMVGVGNTDFAAWIEPGDTAVTITIDSNPQVRHPLSPYDDCEKKADEYFHDFLERYGVTSPEAQSGTSLTTELQRLGNLYARGILTDEEFAIAKQKLLNY